MNAFDDFEVLCEQTQVLSLWCRRCAAVVWDESVTEHALVTLRQLLDAAEQHAAALHGRMS